MLPESRLAKMQLSEDARNVRPNGRLAYHQGTCYFVVALSLRNELQHFHFARRKWVRPLRSPVSAYNLLKQFASNLRVEGRFAPIYLINRLDEFVRA